MGEEARQKALADNADQKRRHRATEDAEELKQENRLDQERYRANTWAGSFKLQAIIVHTHYVFTHHTFILYKSFPKSTAALFRRREHPIAACLDAC
jgi:hypothetical protein